MKSIAVAAVLVIPLAGCVSTHITKATGISDKNICIIDNPEVPVDFRAAFERQIRAKGYQTRIIRSDETCATTTTYEASYGFHWGVYLAAARLKVFSNGREVGQAVYRAPRADMTKHGRVEGKIEALVSQLLP